MFEKLETTKDAADLVAGQELSEQELMFISGGTDFGSPWGYGWGHGDWGHGWGWGWGHGHDHDHHGWGYGWGHGH